MADQNNSSTNKSSSNDNVVVVDYGAGNLQSVLNALEYLQCTYSIARNGCDIGPKSRIILPGVGCFEAAVKELKLRGLWEPLKIHLASNRPFLGICIGFQLLATSSEESLDRTTNGFNVLPQNSVIRKFHTAKPIPHIGWNLNWLDENEEESNFHCTYPQNSSQQKQEDLNCSDESPQDWESWITSKGRMYFVHSYRLGIDNIDSLRHQGWNILTSCYVGESFISYIRKGQIIGTQFHPEKSGTAGLSVLQRFIKCAFRLDTLHPSRNVSTVAINSNTSIPLTFSQMAISATTEEKKLTENSGTEVQSCATNSVELTKTGFRSNHIPSSYESMSCTARNGLAKRIIACLDVRALDNGKLAVTKGNQYDVRETGRIRNLGNPSELAEKYYNDGADEVVFLSIKSYSTNALLDNSMLQLICETARRVFVPLCVGGGIRDTDELDPKSGKELKISAVDIASAYFRAGADKISIGSDAVIASEKLIKANWVKDGKSSVEQISAKFGTQAVVLSVDAKRVRIDEEEAEKERLNGRHPIKKSDQQWYIYLSTIKGGRETRNLDVVQLVTACEYLGVGEILLNCINQDASSGAGCIEDFEDVFKKANADAALAAGVFHREALTFTGVKCSLKAAGLCIRDLPISPVPP